mgnify:CR=1 FL=1
MFSREKLNYFILFIAYYHVNEIISDNIFQSEVTNSLKYIACGLPKDNLDGFELISRVYSPQIVEVFVTFKADIRLKIAKVFLLRAKLLYIKYFL